MKTGEFTGAPPCIWCGGREIKEIAAADGADERWFHCADCRRVFNADDSTSRAGSQGILGVRAASTRIRIAKIPPSIFLEGVDLRPYDFQPSRTYDVPRYVAEVLIDWGYAEPAPRR
jgi:hypothetical protein